MTQAEPTTDEFYDSCLRLHQLCVGKRYFILMESRAQYYADPWPICEDTRNVGDDEGDVIDVEGVGRGCCVH